MAEIKMCECKSSQIHAHGHDPESNTMALQFKVRGEPGPIYHYEGVTRELYDKLVAAESIGKHFHENFRGNDAYKVRKV